MVDSYGRYRCQNSGFRRKGKKLENINSAQVGYQAAVNLWGTVVQSSWSRFNAMVVANSIIISMLSLILTNRHEEVLLAFAIILSIIGISLTVFWQSLMERDSQFQHLYAVSAFYLERSLQLNEDVIVKTVLNGAQLSEGYPVKYPDEEVKPETLAIGDKTLQMKCLAAWTTRDNIKIIITLFTITYLSIIGLAWWLYVGP